MSLWKYIFKHKVDIIVLFVLLGSFIYGELNIETKIIGRDFRPELALIIAVGYVINNIVNKAKLVRDISEGKIIIK